jgi:transcription elongation factor GreA
MRPPITQAGYDKLTEELDYRIKVRRREIIEAISEARAHGDLSENAEYDAAKEEQGLNESRISFISEQLSKVTIVDTSNIISDNVSFGAYVRVLNEDTDEEFRYQIVSELESNLEEGRISNASPLGRSLLNRTVGDTATVRAPGGERFYEILDVKYED